MVQLRIWCRSRRLLCFPLIRHARSYYGSQQRGHVVIPFVAGYDDIAGKILKLDHIENRDLRPLDDLLRDHFFQGVLKNMKGVGEPAWDHEDALGDGALDLSRQEIWGGATGREHLEYELAHRLHGVVAREYAV